MKKLFIILVILLMASVVSAAPFLVCDNPVPADNVTDYVVYFSDGTEAIVPAPLHWDVGVLQDGTYALEVRAKNMWGVSSAVPFTFTKKVPDAPSNIKLR